MNPAHVALTNAVEKSVEGDPELRSPVVIFSNAICSALESLDALSGIDLAQGSADRRAWYELARDERDNLLRLRDDLRLMAEFDVCPECGHPDCCCMIDADHPNKWVSQLFETA